MSPSLLFAVAVAAAPAGAAPLYRATLQAPATRTLVVRETQWTCAGSACAAPRVPGQADGNVCAAVARRLGRVTRFEAAARVFDAAELARCNAAVD